MDEYQDMDLEMEMGALDGIESSMDDRILKNLEAPISGVPTPQSVIPEDNSKRPEAGMEELDEELGMGTEDGFDVDELEQASELGL